MPATKKSVARKQAFKLKVGNMELNAHVVPTQDVIKANDRIQKKVDPIFHEIKKRRRAAYITASKIILNA